MKPLRVLPLLTLCVLLAGCSGPAAPTGNGGVPLASAQGSAPSASAQGDSPSASAQGSAPSASAQGEPSAEAQPLSAEALMPATESIELRDFARAASRTLLPGDGDYEAVLALARARLPEGRPLGGVDGRGGVAEGDFWPTCQASGAAAVILRYDPRTGRTPAEARFTADSLALLLSDVPNGAYADAYPADSAYYLLDGEVVFADFGHLADPGELARTAQSLLG